jgi:hypothetical protein
MNELELIEKKEIREEYINRIEVLEKVKGLLLLPDIMLATTQQVADFYEVDSELIRKTLENNKEEIISDGYIVWKAENFKSEYNSQLKITTNRGNFQVEFSNGQKEKFSPRGVGLFTRRAVLRIGMLLRDSTIAKEVRTQLLNIEEKTTNEEKILSITEEQQLMINVMYAKSDSDRLMAFSKYNDYKNRYINSLENKVEGLVNGILTWNAREGINRMARQIANKTFKGSYPKAWDKISAEMMYKHNIGITSRKQNCKKKKPTIFDVITSDEMPLLVQSCLSLCETYDIDTNELFVEFK